MMAQNADPIHNFVSRITQIRHVVSRITPIHQLNKTNKILQENYITKTLHCIFLVLFYFWNCVGTPPPLFWLFFTSIKIQNHICKIQNYMPVKEYTYGVRYEYKNYTMSTQWTQGSDDITLLSTVVYIMYLG